MRTGIAQLASLLFGYLSIRESLSKFALSEEVAHHLNDLLVIAEPYRRGCAWPADPDKPLHQTYDYFHFRRSGAVKRMPLVLPHGLYPFGPFSSHCSTSLGEASIS